VNVTVRIRNRNTQTRLILQRENFQGQGGRHVGVRVVPAGTTSGTNPSKDAQKSRRQMIPAIDDKMVEALKKFVMLLGQEIIWKNHVIMLFDSVLIREAPKH
jgi:hypothetical protein